MFYSFAPRYFRYQPHQHFSVVSIHTGAAGSLMEVFCSFGGNEGDILPGRFSLNGSVFFDDVPVLYPVVPRLGMTGEVNDDFIFVVFIDGLLGKQGLTIQIVEVVVFLVDIEAFTVKHFIMNVLIMVREAVSYTLDVFFCASDDVVKEIFSHPKLHIDEHHAGIEVAVGMHALGIGLFSAIRYDGDSISLKVQFLSLIHISEPTRLVEASRMPSSA